jgi:putative membrane protein
MKLYLKGLLMGVCDLVPGISGGTIALITGIYERLIKAIYHINPSTVIQFIKALFTLNKSQIHTIFKKVDGAFLLILFAGVISAILLGARLMSFLLAFYAPFVLSFFIGLIIASCKGVYQEIQTHSKLNSIFILLGFITGIALAFLSPQHLSNPSLLYISISGFLAIMALFLPGISGSFILLILGLYEFILKAVHNPFAHLDIFISFAIGAILGVYIISRVITFLFKLDKCKTLYFLLGLVVGTLGVPVKRVLEQANDFSLAVIITLITLAILGAMVVLFPYKKLLR